MDDCDTCSLNLFGIDKLSDDWIYWKCFYEEHNIIKRSFSCRNCKKECRMAKENKSRYWVCGKLIENSDSNFETKKCRFKESIFKDTWFARTKLDIKKIIILSRLYLEDHFVMKHAVEMLQINKQTVTDYTSFFREVLQDFCYSENKKIGGEHLVVEVDEAKFGKRKNHKGRLIEGQWVFGGFCVQTKQCFFVAVKNRTKETLLQCIKDWIHPGTTIVSDCWHSYDCLNSEGFIHLNVNHTYNFVDPITGAHTNNIERQWRDVRGIVQKMGRKSNYDGHLSRAMYLKMFKSTNQRVHRFWKHIGDMYSNENDTGAQ